MSIQWNRQGILKMCMWIQNLCMSEGVAMQHRPAWYCESWDPRHTTTPHLTHIFKCYNGSNPGIILRLLERQGKQPFSVVIFLLFLFPVLNKSFPSLNLRFQDCKMCLTWDSKDYSCAQFCSPYTKIKAVQRRLAGPYIKMTDRWCSVPYKRKRKKRFRSAGEMA